MEKEDSKFNFVGDKWLRNNFEMMDDQDEKKPLKEETKEDCGDEDVISMANDTWMKQSFEMEEEEEKIKPRIPKNIKLGKQEKQCSQPGKNSEENLTDQNINSSQLIH